MKHMKSISGGNVRVEAASPAPGQKDVTAVAANVLIGIGSFLTVADLAKNA